MTSSHASGNESLNRLWDGLVSRDSTRVAAACAALESVRDRLPEADAAFLRGLSLYGRFRESLAKYEIPKRELIEEAISCLEETRSSHAGPIAAIKNTSLGELRMSLGQCQPALTALRFVTRPDCTDRGFAHARLLLARALVEIGRKTETQAVLRQLDLEAMDPDHRGRALMELVGLHEKLGQRRKRNEYMRQLEMLLEKDAASIPARVLYDGHMLCGSICLNRPRDPDRAIRHLERAAEVRESEQAVAQTPHEPYLTLGHLYLRRNEYVAVCSVLETALAKAEDARVRLLAHVGLGLAYMKRSNTDRASEHLREALELSQNDDERASVTLMTAHVRRQQEHWAEAYELYSEVLNTDVPIDRLWGRRRNRQFYLGLCLFKLGRTSEARTHLRRAITPWPRLVGRIPGMESGAYFFLGSIAEQEGNLRRAIRLYRKARKHAWTEEMLYRSPDPAEHGRWLEDIYNSAARCYDELGKPRKAARYGARAARVLRGDGGPSESSRAKDRGEA